MTDQGSKEEVHVSNVALAALTMGSAITLLVFSGPMKMFFWGMCVGYLLLVASLVAKKISARLNKKKDEEKLEMVA